MRFLHTSDWHIGRTIRNRSRADEQEAALQQVLTHAREQAVDCLLLAGDVFDTSAPSAESERLVYGFFRELHGLGIPAVVIAGNHDHPLRFEAVARILGALDIHLVGRPVGPESGGVIEVRSRDGKETARVAALPWVPEREAVDFGQLQQEPGAPLAQYAERVAGAMRALCAVRPDTCNVFLGHVLVNDAKTGPGGGERELHMNWGIFGVNLAQIPAEPQYVALGHVHRPQAMRRSPAVYYSGSLLQLDFGESEQDKSVNLVEVHPRRPAEVTPLPITAGKALYDLGRPDRGVGLSELAQYAAQYPQGSAWLRVYVDVDTPVANLAALVRETLPHAVDITRALGAGSAMPEAGSMRGLGPEQLFEAFYRSDMGRKREPSPETMALFRRLLDEETHATAEA